jgi:DDE superfamily endonuclease
VHDGRIMETFDALHAIRSFRDSFYECLDRRADALFDLADALLTADAVPSPVHLSLQPSHRRGWGSLYAALAHGTMDAAALRDLLARVPLAGAENAPPVYAMDVSVWDRCDAECSPERGYYYHPSRHSSGQPIVAGWAYQFIAQLNFLRESWTAPVDVARVRPAQDANGVAAEQVKALLGRLGKEGLAPLFVFDAGYDPVKLQQGLEGSSSPCQILVRLRAGRSFYGDPSLSEPPANIGRPRRHGPKMKCKDPSTWPEPSAEHACEDAGYGNVRVRAWAGLHPKVASHEGRGSRGPLPIVVGTLVLVEVERLPRGQRRREPRVLWLWWAGPEGTGPDLGLLWRAYVRRFDLEHTFRFLKQSFGWSSPRFRHPEQADRWTWLVVAAFTQLRLARRSVADMRLPWERRYEAGRLTPVRVHRVVSTLLGKLGTPAKPPKPCGRSPGRPKGRLSGQAKLYPAIKKSA